MALAAGTADDMDMRAPAGAFEEAGNQYFLPRKNYAANRAYAVPLPNKAVSAAPDVHETVFASVQRGKSGRAYKLPFVKFG